MTDMFGLSMLTHCLKVLLIPYMTILQQQQSISESAIILLYLQLQLISPCISGLGLSVPLCQVRQLITEFQIREMIQNMILITHRLFGLLLDLLFLLVIIFGLRLSTLIQMAQHRQCTMFLILLIHRL